MILYTIFLSLAVLITAEDGKAKEKRGIVDYNIPQSPSSKYSQIYLNRPYKSYQQAPVDTATAYTKSAQSILQKSGPVLPPQEYQQYYQPQQQQQQQQVEPQALAYQSAGTKFSPFASGLDKYNFNTKPQYSSASEVSSFSYSSPVVSYSNKGLVKQILGKGASQDTPITYSSPSSKKQYQSPKYQYISVPSTQQSSQQSAYSSAAGLQSADAYSSSPNQYTSSNSLAYSSPSAYTQPSSTYTQPSSTYTQPSSTYTQSSSSYTQPSGGYSQSPNAYSQSASSYPSQQLSYDDASSAYQQLSQKGLFTASEQQPQQQQIYQPSPTVGQKYSFVQAPAPAAYQVQKSPQVNYASQDYSHAPQASASSNYETTNQQQLFYSQPAAEQQYFSVGSNQPKYTKSNGVTYA